MHQIVEKVLGPRPSGRGPIALFKRLDYEIAAAAVERLASDRIEDIVLWRCSRCRKLRSSRRMAEDKNNHCSCGGHEFYPSGAVNTFRALLLLRQEKHESRRNQNAHS